MDRPQTNRREMYKAVDRAFANHQARWTPVLAFARAVFAHRKNLQDIGDLLQRQDAPTEGKTETKVVTKRTVANAAVTAAGLGFAYAHGRRPEPDLDLAARLAVNRTDLLHTRDGLLADRVQRIHDDLAAILAAEAALPAPDPANPNAALRLVDYGNPADPAHDVAALVPALQSLITRFRAVQPDTREARVEIGTATDALAAVFAAEDRLLEQTLDKLVAPFRASAPEFYSDYHKARVIVDLGGGSGGQDSGRDGGSPPPETK